MGQAAAQRDAKHLIDIRRMPRGPHARISQAMACDNVSSLFEL